MRGCVVVLIALMFGGLALSGYAGYQWWSHRNEPTDMAGDTVDIAPEDRPDAHTVEQMNVHEDMADPTIESRDEKHSHNGAHSRNEIHKHDRSHPHDETDSSSRGSSTHSTQLLRLRAPSVGLDVPVGSMKAVNNRIQPVGFTRAYWVRNIGHGLQHNDEGTTYIVMHSVRRGSSPGNALIDVNAGRARIQPGAHIHVGSYTYTVTETEALNKNEIAQHSPVWQDVPHRLVLITCLQRHEGKSVQNVIVYAQRTP